MVHFDFFQCLEIRDDVGPFDGVDRTRQAFLQCLAQHQGEEGAEHMAADGVIALVEDGPRLSNDFAERKISSTIQSRLYFNATSAVGRSVLVRNTHLPSYRVSSLIFCSSIAKCWPWVLRYLR